MHLRIRRTMTKTVSSGGSSKLAARGQVLNCRPSLSPNDKVNCTITAVYVFVPFDPKTLRLSGLFIKICISHQHPVLLISTTYFLNSGRKTDHLLYSKLIQSLIFSLSTDKKTLQSKSIQEYYQFRMTVKS